MTKKRIVIGAIVVIILAAGIVAWYFNRANIAYYFYSKKVAKNPNFAQQQKALKAEFKKVYAHPKDAQSYVDLGAVQYTLGDYASAEKNFKKSLELVPLNVVGTENLIRTYEQTNQYAAAENLTKQFVDKYPTLSETYAMQIELYKSYITDKQNKLPEIYNDAFQKTHDDQFLLLSAGYYQGIGDYKKAISFLQQWLADPANSQNQNRLLVENLLKNYQAQVK